MRPVVQEERSGCGIACVATLAGVSYETARARAASLGIYARDAKLWSDTRYVRRLLEAFNLGAASSETPFTTWAALPDLCLLAIKWRLVEGRPFWHGWYFTGRVPSGGFWTRRSN